MTELLARMNLDAVLYVLNAVVLLLGAVLSFLVRAAAARLAALEDEHRGLRAEHQQLAITLAAHHPTRADLDKVTDEVRVIVQDAIGPIRAELKLMRQYGIPRIPATSPKEDVDE